MQKEQGTLRQKLVCDNREYLEVDCVEEVVAFDEETITANTLQGEMTVTGQGLTIEKLSLDTGELSVKGRIDSVEFFALQKKGGFLAKLFG